MPTISKSKMTTEASTSRSSKVGKPSKKPKESANSAGAASREAPAGTAFLDLDALAKRLGAPDTAFAERTFRTAREADLVEAGTTIDSIHVIEDVPRFAGSALAIWTALSPAQRGLVRLPEQIFALLVHEATQLRGLKGKHDAQAVDTAAAKAEREAKLRQAMRDGITERDLAYDSARNALGDSRLNELDAVVGTADTAGKLANGLNALADFLDRAAKADPEDAESLAEYGAGPDRGRALRDRAESVRELGQATAVSPRRVTQRALDLQDGRVLLLISKVLRAFRGARRADPTILVPELNRLARLFENQKRGAAAPAEPAAPPNSPA